MRKGDGENFEKVLLYGGAEKCGGRWRNRVKEGFFSGRCYAREYL